MFNHFFFESVASEKVFQDFLSREGLVLVMDPPFGGLAEVLSHSVRIIWDDWRKVNSDGNVFKKLIIICTPYDFNWNIMIYTRAPH